VARWVARQPVQKGQVILGHRPQEHSIVHVRTCYDPGRRDEAITSHEQALAARERVLGPDHPDTLTSRNNLAITYWDAGRLDEPKGSALAC
jgi:hypothetical protein